MTTLTAGDRAPDFDLESTGGERISLAKFGGQPVVVYFYPKDGTPGCTAEAIDFSSLSKAFAAKGSVVIGISPDPVRAHERFHRRYELSVRLGSDPDHRVAELYGAWGEKSMFGRKYMGVIRSTFLVGADGKIAGIWRNVRVSGHAEEVLQAIADLPRS